MSIPNLSVPLLWLVFMKSVIIGSNNISDWPCPLGVLCLTCVLYDLFYTFAFHAGLWSRGMTLSSHVERRWFQTHIIHCRISHFATVFLTSGLQGSVNVHRGALLLVSQWQCISSFVFYICTFCSFFRIMANISIFCTRWYSDINFYFRFSPFMRCCKECDACNNWWIFCIVLREITQTKTDWIIANFSVLLLFV